MYTWTCRICRSQNRLDLAAASQGQTVHTCPVCGVKHVVSFAIHVSIGTVMTLEEADREEEVLDGVRRMRSMEVSRDNGSTWRRTLMNVMDVNPRTAEVRPGDLIRIPGRESRYRIVLEDGRLVADPMEARFQPCHD